MVQDHSKKLQFEYSSLLAKLFVEIYTAVFLMLLVPFKHPAVKPICSRTIIFLSSAYRRLSVLTSYLDNAYFVLSATAISVTKTATNVMGSMFRGVVVAPLLLVLNLINVAVFAVIIGIPVKIKSSYAYKDSNIEKNIKYSESHPHQTLDVYRATTANDQRNPVIIFVQGSSWTFSSKEIYCKIGLSLSKHGFVTVIPTYSTHPKSSIEDMVSQLKDAVDWTFNNISEFHGHPNMVHLVGHSCGAHLAICYTLNHPETNIKSVINISGMYDLDNLNLGSDASTKDMFNGLDYAKYSPLQTLINLAETDRIKAIPRLVIIHGCKDKTSPIESVEKVQKILRKEKVDHKVKLYSKESHLELIMEWLDRDENCRLKADILELLTQEKMQLDDRIDPIFTLKALFLRYGSPL